MHFRQVLWMPTAIEHFHAAMHDGVGREQITETLESDRVFVNVLYSTPEPSMQRG